jgi:hypothetical protein
MPLQLKRVPVARGSRWIADAFRLFGRRPLPFTLLFSVFLFVALMSSLLPVVGGPLQLALLPLLSLGFMVASQSALLDGPVNAQQLLEPLRADPQRRRALLVLCLIYGVAAFAILVLSDSLSGQAMARLQLLMREGPQAQPEIDALLSEPRVGRALLLGLALGAVLSVPFWHAAALVHWGHQGVAQALFSSTLAVWRAKGAFVVYFVTWIAVVLLFGLLSALILGLLGAQRLVGFISLPAGLMFSTVFYVSLIFTFNDSFGGASALRALEPPASDPPDDAPNNPPPNDPA